MARKTHGSTVSEANDQEIMGLFGGFVTVACEPSPEKFDSHGEVAEERVTTMTARHPSSDSCVLRIDATDAAVERLPRLFKEHEPAVVYMAFHGRPELTHSRDLLARAVDVAHAALPEVPHPIFVGLTDVDETWRDAFQRAMVMDGVGGFCREPAEQFARQFEGDLVDPAPSSVRPGKWCATLGGNKHKSHRR